MTQCWEHHVNGASPRNLENPGSHHLKDTKGTSISQGFSPTGPKLAVHEQAKPWWDAAAIYSLVATAPHALAPPTKGPHPSGSSAEPIPTCLTSKSSAVWHQAALHAKPPLIFPPLGTCKTAHRYSSHHKPTLSTLLPP